MNEICMKCISETGKKTLVLTYLKLNANQNNKNVFY